MIPNNVPLTQTAGTVPPSSPAQSPSSESSGDDMDVQEYMNRLLNRPKDFQPHPSEPPRTQPNATEPPPEPTVPAEPVAPWNPEEYVPKSIAPERIKSINALREVAIQSNRNAIHVSTLGRVQARVMAFKLSALALLAFGLLFCFVSGGKFGLSMALAVICFIVSGVCFWQSRCIQHTCAQTGDPATPQQPSTATAPGRQLRFLIKWLMRRLGSGRCD